MNQKLQDRFDLLKATGLLPSPKGPALVVMQLTRKDAVSSAELVRAVQADPALVARLLKLANACRVPGGRPILAIKDAIAMLGLTAVRGLALGFSLMSEKNKGRCRAFDYPAFWSRNLARAVTMHALAAASRLMQSDEAFTLGLLSHVGELALGSLFPEEYARLLERAPYSGAELMQRERQTFEFDHADLTAALLADWGFPASLIEPVLHHEQADGASFAAESRSERLLLTLMLASKIADVCMATKEARRSMMAKCFLLGGKLSVGAEELLQLCDGIVRDWSDWCGLLEVPSQVLPPFAELMNAPPAPTFRQNDASPKGAAEAGFDVLVVDGDRAIRNALKLMLTRAGYICTEAENGRQGLELARSGHPDFIIVDWTMPEMNGVELVRALRESAAGRALYILLLTGLDQEQRLGEAFAAGADDFLAKPLRPAVLLGRLLAGQRVVTLHREIKRDQRNLQSFATEFAKLNQRLEQVRQQGASSQKRMELALRGGDLGMWDWHLPSGKVVFNERCCTMLGYRLDELKPHVDSWRSLVHPEDRGVIDATLALHLKGKTAAYESEHRVRHKDGHWVWILDRGLVVDRDAAGASLRIVGTHLDITERKQAELYEQFRSRTLELLAGDEPLCAILEFLVRGVEQLNPTMLCSILLLDSEGRHLGRGVAPSLPDFYNAALEGVEIGMGVGSCGTAAFTGKRVVVEDIATHPYWASFKELAASAGLGACWSQPIWSSSGQVLGTFAIYYREAHAPAESDISVIEQSARLASIAIERKRAEAELRIAAAAFDSRESMIVTDANRVILRVNKAFTETTGYASVEVVGRTPRLLQSGRQNADFYRVMRETIDRAGVWQGEVWDRRKNGEEYPILLTISAVKDDAGAVTQYIGSHHDIAERKQAEAKINELAFYDQLTGLPNRTLLLDRLKQAIAISSRSGSYGALLFIDLDNFKSINDTRGHEVGNMLLKQVAQRLKLCVREGDSVTRLGGDEFVVVLAGLSAEKSDAASGTETAAEKILASIGQTYMLGDIAHTCTASIGVTLFAGSLISIDDLMKQADLTMYKAKAAGRNTIRFFDPAMEIAVKERVALEADMRQALAAKQFTLHYQAQMAADGRLTGAEVLLRWQHPQRGLVSPVEFIPLAEETGFILPLGHWVLETACAQLALWTNRAEMAHLTLAVNVSAHQLRQPGFVDQVLAVLKDTGADPRRLKLELTESLLVHDVEDTIEKMLALKARGVGFSLDDFGTGYSSLSYLKRLPLDQLKIDRSFVSDVLVDANAAAIARTIVALAQNLGMGVIAEGVETETQRDFLAGAGCHAYQGYYFSRPLPIDGFDAFAQRITLT